MRWLADECVHAVVVRELRNAGHDVIYAAEVARQTSDARLADRAARDNRILLTEDKDFGEIAFREPFAVHATVLLRIAPRKNDLKWPRLRDALAKHGGELGRAFTVVDEKRIRMRRLDERG